MFLTTVLGTKAEFFNLLPYTGEQMILTGFPTRVHKRHATVKYMFYNPEDVKVRKMILVVYLVLVF